jgi:protein TonB
MSFYQPRFFLIAVLIHIALFAALQLGMMRPTIVTTPQVQEITARLIAPPEPLPVAHVEPPKPKPVKKEIQAPQPKPIPRPVLPTPTQPSERAIEVPAQPSAPSEPVQTPPVTALVQEPDPPPPPPVITQPNYEASYLANPAPRYPSMSKRLNETGSVLLRVLVKADGKAADVKLKKSSGFSRLDDAAMSAVRDWRFLPAKSNGKPIDYWYDVPINFRLD